MNNTKWYNRPLRIGAMQWNQDFNTFKVPEVLAKGGFNTEQLLHILSGDDNLGATVFDSCRDSKTLSEYIRISREKNIRIILYFNAHMMDVTAYQQNNGWAQKNISKEPLMAYEKFILTCVNSGWRDWFMNSVRTALDYGIDGIFLDGPIFGRDGCYCDQCSTLFKEKFKHPIENATSQETRAFKTESIAGFIRDVQKVIKSSGYDAILYANSHGLSANITGCDIDAIYPYVDFLGTEGGFMYYGNPNNISLWYGSRNAKYLDEKSKGKPAIIFAAGNTCPWTRYMHTQEESRLLFASAVANGANVWYGIHGPLEVLDTPGGKAAYEFNRYLAENEEYYAGTRKISDMALLWSKNTIHAFPGNIQKSDFVQCEEVKVNYTLGNYLNEFNGFYEMLTRKHMQFSIIDEKAIAENTLSRFKMLIMPNVCCISDNESNIIKDYVANGGIILATSGTSYMEENGKSRSIPSLADIFGIKEVQEVFNYKLGCSYMKLSNDAALLENTPASLMVGPSTSVKCNYINDVNVKGIQYMPMNGGYDIFPSESFPTLIVNNYGKGKVIYISGSLGEAYYNFLPDALKILVENLIKSSISLTLEIENAYESIEIEARIQPEYNRLLLHFVNYTGQMQRPINKIIPCRDINIKLKTSERVAGIKALYDKRDISFEFTEEGIRFSLDILHEYELVVIQLE
jgi:Beta-galactosidase trimerisation domain.